MGVERNEAQWRMHGVDKMDTGGNVEGKLEIWKEEGLGVRLTRVEKIMVLDCRRSEMVVNSSLGELEGRMRLMRMCKLIQQVGKKKRGTNEWR